MDTIKILRAMADEMRFEILTLLLEHNYCVRALSKKLGISESATSQHIKVLKKAGLLTGVKKGYFMHYDVNRDTLHELSAEIKELSSVMKGE